MIKELNTYFDSREILDGQTIECDLVIIGGGAAGITIAKEFEDAKAKVCLLESGGFSFEEDIDELNDYEVIGHNYPPKGQRLRFFGGTTNHWGGHCVPMRKHVFEKREWIPYSGWPFSIGELHPYYKRAHEIIGIGPYDDDPTAIAESLGYKLFPFDPKNVETQLSYYHRQRFGEQYKQILEDTRNISVFLYATVTSINLDTNKRCVTNLTVKTLAKNSFNIKSKFYILAAGGIENARLLLLSNRDMPPGLGNEYDLVGRFFQEHIQLFRGYIVPSDQDETKVAIYGNEIMLEEDYAVRCHLVIPELRERELKIPEYRAELSITKNWKEYYEPKRTAGRLKRAMKSMDFGEITSKDILKIIKHPSRVFADEDSAPLFYGIINNVEQVPNPNSRIILNDKKDALGQNRVSLNWQLSSLDMEGMVQGQQLIAQEVGRSGIGRMNVFIPEEEDIMLEEAFGASHHMGTTRMHIDPKQGVVDPTCRIHGLDNIYIAGSSVFPTCGYSNPTLTITALAVRLADHLKNRFAKL